MDDRLLHQFSGFLETPQIWDKTGIFPYPAYKLKTLDIQEFPESLNLPPTMVLGKRMERFFQFYVTHFSEERIIAQNQQIISEKKTLGELDFLLKNERTERISHVELVYKFYLYDPEIPAEAERWTGPNHRDNLNRKLDRLLKKQFPLLHREETKPLLDKLGVQAQNVEQKICFKANFFLPWEDPSSYEPASLATVQGRWLHAEKFVPSRFGTAQFFSPKKPDWPILPQNHRRWYSFEEIKEQINPLLEKEQSPLIWMKTQKGEFQRFFVVWW